MLALRWLLMAAGVAMFGTAAGVVAYDVYLAMQFQKVMGSGEPGAAEPAGPPETLAETSRPIRWVLAAKIFALGMASMLMAMSFAMVPEGSGGVRISQISGVEQQTLYPGVHLVFPLIERMVGIILHRGDEIRGHA